MNKTKHMKKIIALISALVALLLVMVVSVVAATAPKAPDKVTATQTENSITLSWSKVSGATGYRIYYKFPRDLHWETAVSSTTATSKTWNNLPSGEFYIFAVRSYTKSGSTVIWGGNKQTSTATAPKAPEKVTAYPSMNSIILSWSEVEDATGYRVYYKTPADTSWKTATSSVEDTEITYSNLAFNKKYTFAVRSYIKTVSGVIWGGYKEIGASTAMPTTAPATTWLTLPTLATTGVSDSYTTTAYMTSHVCTTAQIYPSFEAPAVNSPTLVVASIPKNDVTIKSSPSSDGEAIAVHPKGYPIYIIARQNGYCLVESHVLGYICGWVEQSFVEDYSTTAPAPAYTEGETTIAPTNASLKTPFNARIITVDMDDSGVIYAEIDHKGWGDKFKSNSQRISVYVDGCELEEKALLQISSAVSESGYQYVYIDLSDFDIDTDNSIIEITIPEGFLENKSGTKYNYAFGFEI